MTNGLQRVLNSVPTLTYCIPLYLVRSHTVCEHDLQLIPPLTFGILALARLALLLEDR